MTATLRRRVGKHNSATFSAGAPHRHSSFCSSRIAPTRRVMAFSLGKMPTTSVRRRGAHIGQHVGLDRVHHGGALGYLRPELVGNLAPLHLGGLGVPLGEGDGDQGDDHAVALAAGMRQQVAPAWGPLPRSPVRAGRLGLRAGGHRALTRALWKYRVHGMFKACRPSKISGTCWSTTRPCHPRAPQPGAPEGGIPANPGGNPMPPTSLPESNSRVGPYQDAPRRLGGRYLRSACAGWMSVWPKSPPLNSSGSPLTRARA